MTRPLSTLALLLVPALAVATGAPASAEPAARAVAECRAELRAQLGEDALRGHRVAGIAGNSRGTRVTIVAQADRRYRFECVSGRDGALVAATLDPPRPGGPQLAAGRR